MEVGMISLTPEMNQTLRHPTRPMGDGDETPLIQLDVFHQLHCLNAIRNIVYGTNQWYDPNDRQDQIHIGGYFSSRFQIRADKDSDHCLDYL